MGIFPEGFEEMGWSAAECDRLQQDLGDEEFFRLMFQYGVSLANREVVEQILNHGISVDAPIFNHGATALLIATGVGEEMMRFLLERGASPNVEDSEGVTPLGKAILGRQVEIVQLLLENGADPWHRIPWYDLRESAGDIRTEIIVQMLLQATAQHEEDE